MIFCRYLNAVHQGFELTLAGGVSLSLPVEPPKHMADGVQNLTLPFLGAMREKPWHEPPNLGTVRPPYPCVRTQTCISSLSVTSRPPVPRDWPL
ncbi:hypothetical protein ROHU_014478 [Labeo rohita]|uniref:Uncharacterized protein n=1 Tax=Labeo rohita TaxID=84645 RepID=A0A498NUF9_LABRO|nr:hypothetical protein ROHU_014478 [Labeo rohita]